MKEYKVTYYFNDDDSFVAHITANSDEDAIYKVSKMIEDKKVILKPGANNAWGYNLANVTKFHISL